MTSRWARYRTSMSPCPVAICASASGSRTATEGADAPAVLLIHGVTASHLSWPPLPSDFRSRGSSRPTSVVAGAATNSADRPGSPRTHATSSPVLDALEVERVVVVGHSMGAFVALVLGELHPERVSRLVLVDGGLPLDVPAGLSSDEIIRLVLGPTADRLAMRFSSLDDYLDFWRAHPAFRRDWSPVLEAYLAYDLVGEAPSCGRPRATRRSRRTRSTRIRAPPSLTRSRRLRHPTLLLTAERGLLDQVPALYSPERLPDLLASYPGLRHEAVDDVNHYTIVLSERGADAVAGAVRAELAAEIRPSGS